MTGSQENNITSTKAPAGGIRDENKGPNNTTSYICFALSGFFLIFSIGLFAYSKRL